jgi:histidine ammonia-lyase
MMLIRANVLAKGFSGIRPLVAKAGRCWMQASAGRAVKAAWAQRRFGALAHMALVLMGEGEAEFAGQRMAGGAARRAGIAPSNWRARRRLAHQRHTGMLAVGCIGAAAEPGRHCRCGLCPDARRAARAPRAFDERVHAARPHGDKFPAPAACSAFKAARFALHATCRRVQDAYSLRCARGYMAQCATPRRGAPRFRDRAELCPQPAGLRRRVVEAAIFTASRWLFSSTIWRWP